jgi:hypothetical protein
MEPGTNAAIIHQTIGERREELLSAVIFISIQLQSTLHSYM